MPASTIKTSLIVIVALAVFATLALAADGLSRNDRALRAIEARTDSGDVKLRAR